MKSRASIVVGFDCFFAAVAPGLVRGAGDAGALPAPPPQLEPAGAGGADAFVGSDWQQADNRSERASREHGS